MKEKLVDSYAKAMFQITSILHVAQGVDPSKIHLTALKIIKEHHEDILKNINTENFATIYQQVNDVDALLTINRANTNDKANEIVRMIDLILVNP